MAVDIGADRLSNTGVSVVPRTERMMLRKTLVNWMGICALSQVFWILMYAARRTVSSSSCLHAKRCSKVSSVAPQHGQTSVARLHLYQLWPTGSHRYIILLVRAIRSILWDVRTLPMDVQLMLWNTASSILRRAVAYSIMAGDVFAYSTLSLKWVVTQRPSSFNIAL